MTKKAAAKFRQELTTKCAGVEKACPQLDCMRVEGACIDGRCVQL